MGPTHGASGAAVGLAVGNLASSPAVGLACGAVGYVAAYGPDIDHPASTASRSLGPITGLLCMAVRGLSALVGLPKHRGLSHTTVFAAFVAVLAGAGAGVWLPVEVAVFLAASTAAGWLAALAGDWVTKTSLPFLWWPFDVDTPGPPRWLRLRTGGFAERWLVLPLMCVLCVAGFGLVVGVGGL